MTDASGYLQQRMAKNGKPGYLTGFVFSYSGTL